jgi:hypothetical protein
MQHIVNSLNTETIVIAPASSRRRKAHILDCSERRRELRRLVGAWMKSGPNLKKLFSEDRDLQERTFDGSTQFISTDTGGGYFAWTPKPSGESGSSQEDQAVMLFMLLIANPEWELIGGPCDGCSKYYLRNTKRQKIYCSRNCGSGKTARAAIAAKRNFDRQEKLRDASLQIEKWNKLRQSLFGRNGLQNKRGIPRIG